MTRYYSTVDAEYGGNFYEGRFPEGAIPQVSQSVPEFFAGVEIPENSRFTLSNLDNAITDIKMAGGFKRGKKVIISKAFGSINQGLITIDPSETYVEYRGVINSSSIGVDADFDMLPADIDVLDKEFPFERVTVDMFPNAIDIDDAVPFIVGIANQVPLALVQAQETPSEQYLYLVGRDNLTIDNVYRDKLALPAYTGTATATTTTTVTLPAGLQQADDFYNNKFIEMNGQVRRITDYVKSTNIATVTPSGSWTAGALTIREWKKTTTTISSVLYTLIEFARRQRDTNEQLYQRDRMSADIQGLSAETNPARFIETVLGYFPDVALNAAGFTTAANAITAEGNLAIGGALIESRRVFDVLNQACLIGRLRLVLNDDGEFYPVMDGTEDAIYGKYIYNDNIISIGTPTQQPLNQLWKTLSLRYRLLFDENDFRLTTAKHDVNASEGRIDQVLDFDLIENKTTADKVCDYLAKRKNSFDYSYDVVLNHEARGLELGRVTSLELNIPEASGLYQIVKKSLAGEGFGFTVIPYSVSIFTYTAGALPSDPVTDDQADFRFTPAAAVTGLSVSTVSLPKNFKAVAKLTWTNPTINFTQVLVAYKKTADSLYTYAGLTAGESAEVVIDAGTAYDYQVISYNKFNDPELVGVATLLNQTSAGTSATPSVPGTPSLAVKFRTFQGSLASYTKPSNFLRFEWQYTDNAGTSVGSPVTSEGLTAPPITEEGTGSVTRRVKVRAIGIKSDSTEVASAYSSLSAAQSSAQIARDDAVNNDFNKQNSNNNSGPISVPGLGGFTDIISTTLDCVSGQNVFIHWGCVIKRNAAGQSAVQVRVLRGASTIYGGASTYMLVSEENRQIGTTPTDGGAPAGNNTYKLQISAPSDCTVTFAFIAVNQYKR